MGRSILQLIAAVALSCLAAEFSLSASQLVVAPGDGEAAALDEGQDLAAKFWLQQLVVSALYRDAVEDSTLADWAQVSQALPNIRCVYQGKARIAIPERRELSFEEVVVPVPQRGFPAFIYLKTGSTVLRLAKYDPWVFEKLKFEAGLSSAPPQAKRGLF
jgi:hypothetical protein